MRLIISLLVFVVFSSTALSQSAENKSDTIFNQTDKQGKKQGYWKVRYEKGALKYTAFFKDDKPIGEMRRYFEDNSLKAIINFRPDGKKSYAKLYYQSGPLAAEGLYINSVKDSTWKYYSYYNKTLTRTETYVNGQKHGKMLSYYPNGKLAEEIEYKNGVRDGVWKQYFENGKMKMYSAFTNGKRTGNFVFNYPNDIPEWTGKYVNDKMEGKWLRYNESGKIIATIEYKDGIATNEKELSEKETEMLRQLEKKRGTIAEPDESNIMGPTRQ
jgi:antitoxin component YwqK of YwqJK toxin-antitoxin module